MTRWIWLLMICSACAQSPYSDEHRRGEQVYQQACAHCHDHGEHGAQRIGDREGWRSRLGQGTQVLIEHSLHGYEGAVGYMPARGGVSDLTDAEVAAAVEYLLFKSR